MLCFVAVCLADTLNDLHRHHTCRNKGLSQYFDRTMSLLDKCIDNTVSLINQDEVFRHHEDAFIHLAYLYLGTSHFDRVKGRSWPSSDRTILREALRNLEEVSDWFAPLPPDAPFVICDDDAWKMTSNAQDIWYQVWQSLRQLCR